MVGKEETEERRHTPKPKKLTVRRVLIALGTACLVAAVGFIKKIPEHFWKEEKTPNQNQNIQYGPGGIQIIGTNGSITITPPPATSYNMEVGRFFFRHLPMGISTEAFTNGFGPVVIQSLQTGLTRQYYCYPQTKLNAFYEAILIDFGLENTISLGTANKYPVNWVFVDSAATNQFRKLSREQQSHIQLVLLDSKGKVSMVKIDDSQIAHYPFQPTHVLNLCPTFDDLTYAALSDYQSTQIQDAIDQLTLALKICKSPNAESFLSYDELPSRRDYYSTVRAGSYTNGIERLPSPRLLRIEP